MVLGFLRRKVAGEVRAMLGEGAIALIDESALSLGLESLGKLQARGNGCLALTGELVLFRQWLPRRDFRIPRDAIVAIEEPRAHLGKTYGRKLLRIRFTNEAGAPDSIALLVSDLPAWQVALA